MDPHVAPLRVLLIQTDPADAGRLGEMLAEGAGAALRLAHVDRLGPGLDRLEKGEVDVLLLDLSGPDGEGLQAFDLARERAPDVAVVLVAEREDEALADEALRRGAQDCLVRGALTAVGLTRAIRHALARKRAEEAVREAQALRSIALLANAVAHEIRNPLAVISGNLELLGRNVGADASAQARIHRAVAAVRRIGETVDQMSRIVRVQPSGAASALAERLDLQRSAPVA